MGGNALKNIVTKRYEREEYFELFQEIKGIYFRYYSDELDVLYFDRIFNLLPSYKNKETFGDMDILLDRKYCDKNIDVIKHLFKPNEIYNNGDVVSFDYKEFQIDFIYMSNENYNTALAYYSYNDLGNLMGRIANKIGVRYGHDGLKMLYYSEDKNKVLFEFNLSKDMRTIFSFLGFNYDRFLEGFNDITDIFNYVIDSEFFSKEIFAYENLNHENRTRNKKRKVYGEFLEYIQELRTDDYKYPEYKNYFLGRIDEFFPYVKIYVRIAEAKKKEEVNKKIKEKFNGGIVREITGLEGEELGKFIKKFKDFCFDFDQYILNTDVETINMNIHDYWECNYD